MIKVCIEDYEPLYVRTSMRGVALYTAFRYLKGTGESPDYFLDFLLRLKPKAVRVRKEDGEQGWIVLKPIKENKNVQM